MVALAAAAFLAIYLFNVPFPWIVAGAALIGYRRTAGRAAVLRTQAPSAKARDEQDFVVDRMYAAGQLAHARPNTRRALTSRPYRLRSGWRPSCWSPHGSAASTC